VKDLNSKEGVSFLLAEQNTNVALKYADYGYILESGRVVMDGQAADLASNEDVKEFYLGISSGERKSFRDVKSYRRRKRWLRSFCTSQERSAVHAARGCRRDGSPVKQTWLTAFSL
jgi:ABC-type multidrug transport system ATPase subunit